MAQIVTDPFNEVLKTERSKPSFADFAAVEAVAVLDTEERVLLTKNMASYLVERYADTPHYGFALAEVAVRCVELYWKATVYQGTHHSGGEPFTHTHVDVFAMATMQALNEITDDPLAQQAQDYLHRNRRISLNQPFGRYSPLDVYLPEQFVDFPLQQG